jgi:hypothetical protein
MRIIAISGQSVPIFSANALIEEAHFYAVVKSATWTRDEKA